MSRRKGKINISKTNTNQNVQLLIVWTIFLGLIILFFHVIYKYIIKKILNYIFYLVGVQGYNANTSVSSNYFRNSSNRALSENSGFAGRRGSVNTNIPGNENINVSENGLLFASMEDSRFRVSMAFCFSKEAANLNNLKNPLIRLSSLTDLFLFVQVDSDQDEQTVLKYMDENGVFESGLKKHRLVFCEKSESIPNMARQLQANIHIDTNHENVEKLANKVPNVSIVDLSDNGAGLMEFVETIESIITTKQ